MLRKLTVILAVIFVVTGCATTKKTVPMKEADDLRAKVTDLENQLQEKDAQIKDLEDELQAANKSAANKGYVQPAYSGVLSAKQIQKALKNAGYYPGAIDGKIGRMTKKAIRAFQQESGLAVDGIVGKATTAKLREYL